MNKKILISLSLIAAVSVIAVGVTIAYYTDIQKAEGNTFAMGEFLLTIDSDCHFNGMDCTNNTWGSTSIPCYCKWDAKSLTDEKFFDFANLKPEDSGEVTISMHVAGDDYYVRSKIDNVKNKDNGCNQPETALGDVNCGDNGGELGANLDFAFWADMGSEWGYQCPAGQPKCTDDPAEGDNILNTDLEYGTHNITNGNEITEDWIYLESGGTHLQFRDGATYYMGMSWCVGTITIGATSPWIITCDGTSVTSIVQTDSYSSDMTFEVVAATNNDPNDPFAGM